MNPLWLTNWAEISNSAALDWQKPEQSIFRIFLKVDLQLLLSHLTIEHRHVLESPLLSSSSLKKSKTQSILTAWIDNIKLLPPVLKLTKRGEITICDGNHRINAALSLKAHKIPLLISNNDLVRSKYELVKKLNLDLTNML